jgi:hypothetical protein
MKALFYSILITAIDLYDNIYEIIFTNGTKLLVYDFELTFLNLN